MGTKEKRTPLRVKLSKQVLAMVIVMLIIMSAISCYTIQRILNADSKKQLLTEAQYVTSEIEGWTEGILNQVNTVLATVKNIGLANDSKKLLEFLETVTMDLDEDMPTGLYAGTEKGEYLDPSGWIPDASYNVKERSWFIEGKNNVTMEFGAPYYGDNLQSNMVSASARVDDNTILATDVVLGSIENLINGMEIAGEGYGFLVDSKSGFMVAHKNQEYTGKNIEDIDDIVVQEAYKSLDKKDQVLSVNDEEQNYFLTLSQVEGTNWVLVTCAKTNVIFKTLRTMIISLIALSVIGALIIGIAIYMRVKILTEPLEGLTGVIDDITNGDLTVEPVVEGNDEIRDISEQLDEFIKNTRSGITELSAVSQVLTMESEGSKEISDEMNEASSSQTEAMRQLNITVEELARSIEEIANSATTLASTVTEVSKQGADAKGLITDTVLVTNQGKDAINQVSNKMNTIDSTMKELELVVQEVGKSSNEINSITTLIGDIANQTNLLALNASIEAARAGDAGKGFAVVATEIGTLASSSTNAVKEIEQLITKVCTQVQDVVVKTASSVQNIQESKGLVANTSATFMDIYDKVNTTADALNVVEKKIQEVDEVATNMAAITEEQSAGTEEILATSENVYNQSVAITRSSEVLRDTADKLSLSAESIKEFTEKYTI
ncbi:MAG: methyl-accepting chemotaxis protein [bacterium]|nr:methyl-accepting chemotaxis protein [bacterium]